VDEIGQAALYWLGSVVAMLCMYYGVWTVLGAADGRKREALLGRR